MWIQLQYKQKFISFHLEEIEEPSLLNLKAVQGLYTELFLCGERKWLSSCLCHTKYPGKYLLMNSLLSFLLLISVCQVCLYRQNSSVSCTPELCNCSRPGQAGKSVMWPLLCHLGSKPSATLGLCSSLPKVTHQLYGSVRSVPSILLEKATCSLAGSPEGSSRFVSVCPCCTRHLVVSANAWLSLLSRVREGKFQISLFLCLPWFSQLHRGDNGSIETAKYLLVWVRILISRVLWKTDCGKRSNSKEESFML